MIIVIAVPPSIHLAGAVPFLHYSPIVSVAVTSSPVMLSAAKHLCAQRTRPTHCHAERSEASLFSLDNCRIVS